MPYFTYDTSVVISRRVVDLHTASAGLVVSSIVLLELMASAEDDSASKFYEFVFRTCQRDESLMSPNEDDWLFAGKILFWLTRRRRKFDGGKLRRLDPGISQRMALDALLAATARRWNAAIITENWKDFKAIQHFCNVKVIKASDFFS